ncbi:MAG: MerR family transcriptional regulator [Lentimicrobiaceae bacterium]|nr:MerR family transcriptional regulator [Lentimicrobiaceae bacterium]
MKLKEDEKMFYSIGEVSKMFGVNTSLVRFWEREFACLKPFKNKHGIRYFTRSDIEMFQTIFYLVKECGYTLQGAKEQLKTNRETIETKAEIHARLIKIKQFLLDIKNEI